MTEKDIKESMNASYEQFNNHAYEGFIPDGLIEKFRVAFMTVPPKAHGLKAAKVAEIAKLREVDLTMIDVGCIVNLLYMCAPATFCVTFEEAVEYVEQLSKVHNEYNYKVEQFQKSMQRKEMHLRRLAGLDGAIQMPSIKN